MSSAGGGLDLGTRLGGLQITRVVAVVAAMAATETHPDAVGVEQRLVVGIGAAYLIATCVIELVRSTSRRRFPAMTGAVLLLDCVAIAAVSSFAAGPFGPLGFLAYVHVAAVLLVVSYRVGLQVAFVHVVLLFVALVDRTAGPAGAGIARSDQDFALGATGLLLVAGTVAVFAALNEREHAARSRFMDGLATLAGACERARVVEDVRSALLAATTTLGFARGAVAVLPDAERTSAPGSLVTQLIARPGPELGPLAVGMVGASNVVVIPLVVDGQVLGHCGLVHGGGRRARIDTRVVERAERLVSHAALAVRAIELRTDIERTATTDALTGLANRRHFDERFAEESERAHRYQRPLSLLVVDVDHFKAVNDTFGHTVGDDVLAHVGATLRRLSRQSDLPARFGGEEFVVLLPETQLPDATAVAERLRREFGDGSGPVPFSVSVGVAELPSSALRPEELFGAADQALYRAKRGGRDCVRAALPARRRHRLTAAG